MKRCLLLLPILGLAHDHQAQQLVNPVHRWNVAWCVMGSCATEGFWFMGDTVIAGEPYQKLYAGTPDGQVPLSYHAAMREDMTGKIYAIDAWGGTEILLYDLGLEVGDVFISETMWGCPVDQTVVQIDTVTLLNGEPQRRYRFSNNEGWWGDEIWIDGIGSLLGVTNMGFHGMCEMIDASVHLLCWYRNDTLLFDDNWYQTCNYNTLSIQEATLHRNLSLHPNPAVDQLFIRDLPQGIPLRYEVRDAMGALAAQGTTGDGSIPVAALPAGAYTLRIIATGGVRHGKFIKE